MSQIHYCSIKEHKDNPVNLVCTHRHCAQRGLICSFCLLKNHQGHVNDVIPLRDLTKALNEANCPKNIQELERIGNIIRKEHDQIVFKFKNYVQQLKKKIEDLEKTIENELTRLKQEAQFFISNQLEKSVQLMNQEKISVEEINKELVKIYPVLKVQNQKVEVFSESEKKIEADRIIKKADVLQREVIHHMEKSLEEFQEVSSSIQRASMKRLQSSVSENRFGMVLEGWQLENTDSISFQNKGHKDRWISGLGIYEVISENKDDVILTISLYEGNSITNKLIYQQEIKVKEIQNYIHHIAQVQLNKVIKMKKDQIYTITCKPNQVCTSFFGANGTCDTHEFLYFDTQFCELDQVNGIKSNSTTTNVGLFPLFFFDQ